MTAAYLTPIGYSSRRPSCFPSLDRGAVMRNAHRIAKLARPRFGSYRAALAFGLSAAWKADWSARTMRSLAGQVAAAVPADAPAQSPIRRQRPMLGSLSYVGA